MLSSTSPDRIISGEEIIPPAAAVNIRFDVKRVRDVMFDQGNRVQGRSTRWDYRHGLMDASACGSRVPVDDDRLLAEAIDKIDGVIRST